MMKKQYHYFQNEVNTSVLSHHERTHPLMTVVLIIEVCHHPVLYD